MKDMAFYRCGSGMVDCGVPVRGRGTAVAGGAVGWGGGTALDEEDGSPEALPAFSLVWAPPVCFVSTTDKDTLHGQR